MINKLINTENYLGVNQSFYKDDKSSTAKLDAIKGNIIVVKKYLTNAKFSNTKLISYIDFQNRID